MPHVAVADEGGSVRGGGRASPVCRARVVRFLSSFLIHRLLGRTNLRPYCTCTHCQVHADQ